MCDPGWRTIVHWRAFHSRGQLWPEQARSHRATTHDAPATCGDAEGSDWPTQSPHGAGRAVHSLGCKAKSQMRTNTCTGIFQESCVDPSYGCTTYKIQTIQEQTRKIYSCQRTTSHLRHGWSAHESQLIAKAPSSYVLNDSFPPSLKIEWNNDILFDWNLTKSLFQRIWPNCQHESNIVQLFYFLVQQ